MAKAPAFVRNIHIRDASLLWRGKWYEIGRINGKLRDELIAKGGGNVTIPRCPASEMPRQMPDAS
jgi:hypothetical protein